MSPNKSGYAPVNGLKMYYEMYGSGKPLVLIHGGGSTIQSNWDKVIPLLAPARQVIAVEMQAHGRTEDIDRNFTFEQDADDIAALLNYLNLTKADIFGFSNGGQIALQVAIRHPKVVSKIVVASIGYTREGFHPQFWDVMSRATFDTMPPLLKDAFLKVNPDPEKLLKMFHRDAIRMNAFTSWEDDAIKSITSPAFIITGDNDVVTTEHAVQMQRFIAGSRLAIFPGGHGEYLGELTTGNNDTKLHETFIAMVNSFLDGTLK
ncbi:MAG TPA: alpha/beta hydrolase [Cyclobacteriaceae bacterium]|nr:alpha/beta hydrolase [Cyclobacteriaceae bacterium]